MPIDEITRLYVNEKKSTNEIALIYKVTGSAINICLKRAGVPRRNDSERAAGNKNPMYGKTHSADARGKIREATTMQFATEEARKRHAELTAKQIASGRTGKTNNRLEQAFAAILDSLGIVYQPSFRMGRFVFDFYLPAYNLLVECDGTFWHADPRFYADRTRLSPVQQHNVANDIKKNQSAEEAGFHLLRFWEQEVHNAPETVEAALQNFQP